MKREDVMRISERWMMLGRQGDAGDGVVLEEDIRMGCCEEGWRVRWHWIDKVMDECGCNEGMQEIDVVGISGRLGGDG